MLALSHQRECVNTKITSFTGERLSRNRRIAYNEINLKYGNCRQGSIFYS